jgi:hypothetical protein
MKVHWAQKLLTIPYNNGHVTLQGMLHVSLECNIMELAHLTADPSISSSKELPMEI